MEVMIDLETYGTTPGSVILSIGAVEFSATELGRSFYGILRLSGSYELGFTSDERTVDWWSKQSPQARQVIDMATAPDATHPTDTLKDFAAWFRRVPGDPGIWGFGATFDNVLLRAAYDKVGIKCPWHYRKDRCFRTLAALFDVDWGVREGTHHNALDDARYQAQVGQKILQKIEHIIAPQA